MNFKQFFNESKINKGFVAEGYLAIVLALNLFLNRLPSAEEVIPYIKKINDKKYEETLSNNTHNIVFAISLNDASIEAYGTNAAIDTKLLKNVIDSISKITSIKSLQEEIKNQKANIEIRVVGTKEKQDLIIKTQSDITEKLKLIELSVKTESGSLITAANTSILQLFFDIGKTFNLPLTKNIENFEGTKRVIASDFAQYATDSNGFGYFIYNILKAHERGQLSGDKTLVEPQIELLFKKLSIELSKELENKDKTKEFTSKFVDFLIKKVLADNPNVEVLRIGNKKTITHTDLNNIKNNAIIDFIGHKQEGKTNLLRFDIIYKDGQQAEILRIRRHANKPHTAIEIQILTSALEHPSLEG